METKKCLKEIKNFICNDCHFQCSKKSNWLLHINTSKHINKVNECNLLTEKMPDLTEKMKISFHCDCGKNYSSRTGVWKHKKKCEKEIKKVNKMIEKENVQIEEEVKIIEKMENKEEDNKMQQILLLLKESKEVQDFLVLQNKELTKQLAELSKTKENVINNTQNNTFNLQVFLNEDCKDAMNLTDFLDYIKFEIQHLDNVGKFGFIKANSELIIHNLKKIGLYKRPIHCTDKKRNNHYIKCDNKWEKDVNNNKLVDFVKKVGNKNYNTNMDPWKKANPDYGNSRSKQNDVFCKIMCEFYDDDKCENVIKNIDKIITIDKKGLIEE